MVCSLVVVVCQILWCYYRWNHIFIIVAADNDFHGLEFECLETIVGRLHHSRRRHSRKTIFVEKVRSYFSDTGFSREHSSPECIRTKGTHMISWVVGRKSLLINRFECRKCLFPGTSQNVSPTCAIICEFWFETFLETTYNIRNDTRKLRRALHGSKHFNACRGSIMILIVSMTSYVTNRQRSAILQLVLTGQSFTLLNVNSIQLTEFGQIWSKSENHYLSYNQDI